MSKINLLAPVCAEDFDDFNRTNHGKEIVIALNVIKYAEDEGLDKEAISYWLNRFSTQGFSRFLSVKIDS